MRGRVVTLGKACVNERQCDGRYCKAEKDNCNEVEQHALVD
jgi:hypothetical protein